MSVLKLFRKEKSKKDIEVKMICSEIEPLQAELTRIEKRWRRNGWTVERISEIVLEVEGNILYWIA